MKHWEKVKEVAGDLAEIPSSADRKFDKSVVELGSKTLEDKIEDPALYGEYVSQFGNEPSDSLEWHELTSAQKKFKSILKAEAYFAVYHLALSLKDLTKGSAFTSKRSIGDGEILVEDYENFVGRRDLYLNAGTKILKQIGTSMSSGNVGDMVFTAI